MSFTVYAIKNQESDKIYVGHTSDLEKRLARHNLLLPNKKSSFTSKNKGTWEVVYCENAPDRPTAIRREKELKSAKGREFLKQIIFRP
jgi:putative endonuclease